MQNKYFVFVFFLLVGCGGGGGASLDSVEDAVVDQVVDQIEDLNDAPDDLPTTFDALARELPWGLHDNTGVTTALRMALYDVFSTQFLARTPILPVPIEPNDDECDFGGNVISIFNLDSSIDDYTTYSISRNANNCRTDEARYFNGNAELEGTIDFRNEDLRINTAQYSTSSFSRSSFIGSIPNESPLKSQLTAVQVNASGDFSQITESDFRDGRQDDTDQYSEESSGITYSIRGYQNTYKLNSHNRNSVHTDLNGNDAFTDNVLVTSVSVANYNSSWVMENNAEGNALMRAADVFAGAASGMGYKYTFPDGEYNLSVQVLTPIVRDERDETLFPSEGSLLVDLSSHNISALLTFSGGAQISITSGGVNVVTSFDESGQVIQ